MRPTGSWPRINPGFTGYSPRTMWTSVPQIVVVVIRMTACLAPVRGFRTSSRAIWSFPLNTTARIDFISAFPKRPRVDPGHWPQLSQERCLPASAEIDPAATGFSRVGLRHPGLFRAAVEGFRGAGGVDVARYGG